MDSLTSQTAEELRHLPAFAGAVRTENLLGLMRRWRLVQEGVLEDPQLVSRWFPGQRDLLSLLAVMSQPEVERVANTLTPLFRLELRCTEFSLSACGALPAREGLEADSIHESFLALSSRLDLIRLSSHQAHVTFSMSQAEANWLSNFCTHELQLLARDPSMVLQFTASPEYVMRAALGELKPQQQTVYSATSRRNSNAVACVA